MKVKLPSPLGSLSAGSDPKGSLLSQRHTMALAELTMTRGVSR